MHNHRLLHCVIYGFLHVSAMKQIVARNLFIEVFNFRLKTIHRNETNCCNKVIAARRIARVDG